MYTVVWVSSPSKNMRLSLNCFSVCVCACVWCVCAMGHGWTVPLLWLDKVHKKNPKTEQNKKTQHKAIQLVHPSFISMGLVANSRCLLFPFCTFVYSLHPLFCFFSFRCEMKGSKGSNLHTGLNIIKAAVRTFICNGACHYPSEILCPFQFPPRAHLSIPPPVHSSLLHIEFFFCLIHKYSMFQPVIYSQDATPRYFHTWTPRRWHS